MKIEEIKKQIEEIEWSLFYLSMKDCWDRSDYDYEKELIERKNELENQLKSLERGLNDEN